VPAVDVLVPTRNRPASLAMTLSGLAGQSLAGFHLILADQSEPPVAHDPVIRSLLRVLEARGATCEVHHRLPALGIAEQRDFLLNWAAADYALFLDDDVWLEPWVLARLLDVIRAQRCGFVGAFGAGLSFRRDVRPEQQAIEYWDGRVAPVAVEPGSPEWERWQIHRAANLYHVGLSLPPGEVRLYKVAWIGACVLYDRRKALQAGGFSFWKRLPRYHSGEEVLLQNLMLRRWGGCGIVPSGAYFSEMPSSVLNPDGGVDGHALDLLPEMVARYAPAGPV
jgi:glycosyltransferase involved in cell wall biosynthesis